MNTKYDLIVVGGGILGTFHAYHALKKGLKVALLEKDQKPQGATVRNFGQVVPSGMNSKWQLFGRESLRLYKEIQSEFDITVRQEGSVYLASNEEEVQLLEELHKINKGNSYNSQLLTKNACLDSYPNLRKKYIMAGLFFPEEIIIEPHLMIHRLHKYLKTAGLDIFYNTTVLECDSRTNGVNLYTSYSGSFLCTKLIICNGSDFKIVYPKLFAESDLEVSKLQMMQTKPQPNYRLKGSILTGLSIRRYEAFTECPSYQTIKTKEDKDSLVKKWGVHILFKQAADGSVILGDSHEYAYVENIDSLGYGSSMDIDNFILQESKKIFDLPTYEIQKRWLGFYSQSKNSDIFECTVDRNIHIVTGIGGKGMTGSAGFSKANIDLIFNFQNA